MNTAGTLGWAIVLLYCVCCALRLARFNTALDDPTPLPFAHRFFTGVPAPAGAGLVLLPMMPSFQEAVRGAGLPPWRPNRAAERSVGKECVSTCRSRGAAFPLKK